MEKYGVIYKITNKINGKTYKEYIFIFLTKANGFNPGKISECCKSKRKTHKKYHWRYA